jgi:hypothetical protein
MVVLGLVPIPVLYGLDALHWQTGGPVLVMPTDDRIIAVYPGQMRLAGRWIRQDIHISASITRTRSTAPRADNTPWFAERNIAIVAHERPDSTIPAGRLPEVLRTTSPHVYDNRGNLMLKYMNQDISGLIDDMLKSGTLSMNVRKVIWSNVLGDVVWLLGNWWAWALGWCISGVGVIALVRSRKEQAWQCAVCLYDLRATPPDKPCPECGSAATPIPEGPPS